MNHPFQHFLIYGDAGAGKTTGAATFPKPALVFMFDPRGKETPYLNRGAVSQSKAADGTPIQTVLHRRSGDVLFQLEHYLDADPTKPVAYSRFLARLTHLEEDLATQHFQTVIVDSVTFMELMARKLAQYKLNPNSREPRQWFASSTDTLEEVLMIRFGSLAVNVVVLAHVNEDKDEVHGMYVRNPSAPGRLSKRSPAGFGELYRAFVTINEQGEREYLWQVRSNSMYNAATQIEAPDGVPQDYQLLWTPDAA